MRKPRTAALGLLLLILVTILVAGSVSAAEVGDVNLVFIHHSVGANWLDDGLCAGLNANGYHVADIHYGWTGGSATAYGDHTDTSDWPVWFTDTVMDLVYPEMDAMTAPDTLSPAPGDNTVIMFKSCYPNSYVGSSSADEKAIYNSLLSYFQDHPDKMFVLCTPPPMASISYPLVTRELCNWLTDRENGWLRDLTTSNVFTFDLYNVLTHPDAHHAWVAGTEMHQVVSGANTLYSGYHPAGDDHPNYTGNAKAAAEFVPLLNAWYAEFLAGVGPVATRYEQTDARLTYLGEWSMGYSTAASRGSYVSSVQAGAAVLAEFTGTQVSIIARTTPWYGEATVSIDGGPEEPVDFYSSWTANRQPVYTKTVGEGTHTLVMKAEGTKNAASDGMAISLDAIAVLGSLQQAATPARYQDSDSDFAYTPTWHTVTGDWNYSNGDFSSVDEAGSVAVEFEGTYCAWLARTTPWYGKAQVILDAGTPAEQHKVVDLYSSTTRYKQKVYDTGLLEDGPHTLNVYWTGERNSASWGTRIGVDSFDMFGTPSEADPAPPIEWRYQQTDPRLTYLGAWSAGSSWSASGGSFASTSQAGAAVVAEFEGTEATLILRTTPWYGLAEVYVDGVSVGPIDLYSPAVGWKVPLYGIDGLPPGTHTIAIECKGEKNPSSAGTSIALDALDIVGYLEQAPKTTRIDDNNATYATYDPAWSRWDASGYWAAYLDTYAFTDKTGDKVTVTFDGTYLSWISRAANTQGKAQVSLYEGATTDPGNLIETQTVDLYSRTTSWKKSVYNTGLLDDGTYTVVIQCLGTKNPASWWYSIGVDAFDVMVTAP